MGIGNKGDLALYSDNSHIGIVAGRDSNGNVRFIAQAEQITW